MRVVWILVGLAALSVLEASAQTDPRQAMAKARAHWEAIGETSEVELSLIDERGNTSKRSFTLWQSNQAAVDWVRIRFREPAHMRGLQLLSKGSEQYLKPPGLKARKIAFREKGLAFAQSEFFYEDLEGWKVDDFAYSLVSETASEVVINAVPKRESVYGAQRITIEKARWVILSIQYFDKHKRHWKTQEYGNYAQAKPGVWRPGRMAMENHLNKRKSVANTVMRKFGKIPGSIFSLSALDD